MILTTLGSFDDTLPITTTTFTDSTCTVMTGTPVVTNLTITCTASTGVSYSLVESLPVSVSDGGYFVTTQYGSSSTCNGYNGLVSQVASGLGSCSASANGFLSQTLTDISCNTFVVMTAHFEDNMCTSAIYFTSETYSASCQLYDIGSVFYAFAISAPTFVYGGSVEVE